MTRNRNLTKIVVMFMIIVLLSAMVLPNQVANAASITVTTTFDGTGGPGCTLRDAITAADKDMATGGCQAGSGPDTIILDSGVTYTLTKGGFTIHSQITIEGNESIIERSKDPGIPDFRIFYLSPDGDLTLNELTIRNGANINEGGGVKNFQGTLTLNYSVITGNKNGGIINLYGASLYINNSMISDNYGGGLINLQGTVVIDHSTISSNLENRNGGGIHNYYGSADIYNSTIRDNTGAGIVNLYGSVGINNSTVSGNFENTNGGGIHNYYGSTDIYNSTFSGNTASSNGGGIYNRGVLRLTNSTVSENTADGNGGGVWSSEEAIVVHSTISNNKASAGSGIYNHNNLDKMKLANTILGLQYSGQTCNGNQIFSLGYNLDSDGSCNLTIADDISGVDPLLGPLQDNGGPTWTHALLGGSPAIDAVPLTHCTLTTDQRYVSRPQGSACDIGSFEVEYVHIDIKPGSSPNSINLESKGVVPVAVLTTDDFDASSVDPVTVLFAGASPVRWVLGDVDLDGDMDLLFHFKTLELNLNESSDEAILQGTTFDNMPVLGQDEVRIVP